MDGTISSADAIESELIEIESDRILAEQASKIWHGPSACCALCDEAYLPHTPYEWTADDEARYQQQELADLDLIAAWS